jgi:hypothetical protein
MRLTLRNRSKEAHAICVAIELKLKCSISVVMLVKSLAIGLLFASCDPLFPIPLKYGLYLCVYGKFRAANELSSSELCLV